MDTYSRQLTAQLQPFLDKRLDDCRSQATKIHQESLSVATQKMRATRYATNGATCQSAAVVLHCPAWLQSTSLSDDAQARIEDFFLGGMGHFNIKTDDTMGDLHKKSHAAKRLNTLTQSISLSVQTSCIFSLSGQHF